MLLGCVLYLGLIGWLTPSWRVCLVQGQFVICIRAFLNEEIEGYVSEVTCTSRAVPTYYYENKQIHSVTSKIHLVACLSLGVGNQESLLMDEGLPKNQAYKIILALDLIALKF